ncbi:quinone oxidoreductase-like protein 1 isoform X2 [Aplysia californica]|uniref:Quinone oxidoreductase-like protein 1 isoform X2 n=1 Tax=Aplysia californica TaxID=6500 RepID=A0ABM1VT48_APLCA|nr:quinone oxidoreductase-like protein 1 isoform X2 [Aplysia californica]
MLLTMQTLRGNFIGPDAVLTNEEHGVPDLGPNDVLIKVKACAVNLEEERRYQQLLTSSLKSCALGRDVAGDIVKIGSQVESLQEGMAVVGFVSFDFELAGCGEMCICNQFDVVEKPSSVSYELAAASIGAGLSAYTAVHYQGHVTAGDTVLVLEGATPRGSFTVQVAQAWGAKVLSTYKTQGEKQILESMKPPVAQAIELTQRTNILASSVQEETGGVGVDCIIDNGVRLFTNEEDKDMMEERALRSVPHKQDIIGSLGFSGKWVSSQPNLQM